MSNSTVSLLDHPGPTLPLLTLFSDMDEAERSPITEYDPDSFKVTRFKRTIGWVVWSEKEQRFILQPVGMSSIPLASNIRLAPAIQALLDLYQQKQQTW